MLKNVVFLWVITLLAACNSNKPKPLSEEEKGSLLLLGDSISIVAQNVLLRNVSEAIQNGGAEYAVEFCHTEAIPLTDSVADNFNVNIQRLSDKNRNPANALKTETDSLVWEKLKAEKTAFIEQEKDGDVYYYKPIMLMMPTCLKCHGGETDIAESTRKIITQKYPNDKAIGYETGDLRGMWKIRVREK